MITQIYSFFYKCQEFTAGPNSIAVAAPIGLLHCTHSQQSTPLDSASNVQYSASTLVSKIFTAGSNCLYVHSGYIVYVLIVL